MKNSVRGILLKENQILLMNIRFKNKGYFVFVGGKIEDGETDDQALIREFEEESGFIIEVGKLVFKEVSNLGTITNYYLVSGRTEDKPLLGEYDEKQIMEKGRIIYEPKWINLKDLKNIPILPQEISEIIEADIENNFKSEVKSFKIISENETQRAKKLLGLI